VKCLSCESSQGVPAVRWPSKRAAPEIYWLCRCSCATPVKDNDDLRIWNSVADHLFRLAVCPIELPPGVLTPDEARAKVDRMLNAFAAAQDLLQR
jgi:hypothetical protein